MKNQKMIFAAAVALSLFACGGDKNAEEKQSGETTKTEESTKEEPKATTLEKGKFPFEFPVVEKINAAAGQNVFAVNMKLVMNDYNAGKTNFGTQYLLSTVSEPGEKESKIKFVSEEMVPNSAIVVIPKGQTAKVGDIVAATWAVNLTRGIVTNASDPKAPKVTFIGLDWDNPAKADDKKTSIGQYEYTLKENEFMVISKDYDPGSSCAVKKDGKWSHMNVFNTVGDMVLGTIFVNFTAVNKADCIPIPLKTNFKVGDNVWAPWTGSMSKGKVTKVNAKMGRYTVKFDESSKGEKVISFGDVIKDLP
jgi:hypothetical protein